MSAILNDIDKAAAVIAAVNAAWPLMMTQVEAAWEHTPNPQVNAIATSVIAQINAVYASVQIVGLPLEVTQPALAASVKAIAQFVAAVKGASATPAAK